MLESCSFKIKSRRTAAAHRLLWGIFGGSCGAGADCPGLRSFPIRSPGWDQGARGDRHTGHGHRHHVRAAQARARPARLCFGLLAPCGLLLWSSSVMSRAEGKGALPTGGLASQFPGELSGLQPRSVGQWPRALLLNAADLGSQFPWEQQIGVGAISPSGGVCLGTHSSGPALNEKPPEYHAMWARSSSRAPVVCQPGLGIH